eukprot:gene8780-728_t
MEDTILIKVGGKTYRKSTKKILEHDEENMIQNEQLSEEEIFEEKVNIEVDFVKFIIGKQGATKSKIENDTNTKIIIPDKKSKSGEIVIKGGKNSIALAKKKIERILENKPISNTTILQTSLKNGQTTVVHCKKSSYDVFIGRPSKWGNPFVIGKEGMSRSDVIEKFEEYLLGNKDLMADLHELKGKVIACYCSPEACHGDILAKYANKLENKIE